MGGANPGQPYGREFVMKKSDADRLERMVRSISRRKYWNFVGWLANAGEGPLWEYMKPKRWPAPAVESDEADSEKMLEGRT